MSYSKPSEKIFSRNASSTLNFSQSNRHLFVYLPQIPELSDVYESACSSPTPFQKNNLNVTTNNFGQTNPDQVFSATVRMKNSPLLVQIKDLHQVPFKSTAKKSRNKFFAKQIICHDQGTQADDFSPLSPLTPSGDIQYWLDQKSPQLCNSTSKAVLKQNDCCEKCNHKTKVYEIQKSVQKSQLVPFTPQKAAPTLVKIQILTSSNIKSSEKYESLLANANLKFSAKPIEDAAYEHPMIIKRNQIVTPRILHMKEKKFIKSARVDYQIKITHDVVCKENDRYPVQSADQRQFATHTPKVITLKKIDHNVMTKFESLKTRMGNSQHNVKSPRKISVEQKGFFEKSNSSSKLF